MDVEAITKAVESFAKKYKTALYKVTTSQSKAMELAATVGISEHYKYEGYSIEIKNPNGVNAFKVKTATRGYPWSFSRILISKDSNNFEIHMNLMVRSAHDEGIYCVDVGVVKAGVNRIQKQTMVGVV